MADVLTSREAVGFRPYAPALFEPIRSERAVRRLLRSARVRARRVARRQAGVCRECPRAAEQGHALCAQHRAVWAARQQIKRDAEHSCSPLDAA